MNARWMTQVGFHASRKLGFALALALFLSGLAWSDAEARTRINFTLDWRFEGPSAPFLMALEKGYFAEEGLEVTIDSGNGSSGALTRIASGTYDIGFADINSLIEYAANNPGTGLAGVYMVYNNLPAAIFTLKESNITTPADLAGKKLGAAVFGSDRKAWPAFAAANGLAVDSVTWQNTDPAIRETLLARKQLDGIAGFYFTSLLNLEARGVAPEDLNIITYWDHGVALYGNAIIANGTFLKNNPEAVAGFNRAFNRALVETLAQPEVAIKSVVRRDGLANEALELRRLKLALEAQVITDESRSQGLGDIDQARFERSIEQVVSSFGLSRTPAVDEIFTSDYLPARAARSLP